MAELDRLDIIVCVKQVSDPEVPPSAYLINESEKRVYLDFGVPQVLNPDDECALEAALALKDQRPAVIHVLSLGDKLAPPILRKCLAAGADQLTLLQDPAFGSLDSYSVAHALSNAVRKLGRYDLILCGEIAADSNAGVVGLGIAELLGVPSISSATRIEVIDNRVRVTQRMADSWQVVEAPLPTLVTVASQAKQLRTPSVKQLIEARKAPITIWRGDSLDLNPSVLQRTRVVKVAPPLTRPIGTCRLVSGETPEAVGVNLALELENAGRLQSPASRRSK